VRLLDGTVAIVTGGGRGLGRSHALTLAAHGAAVLVNDLGTGMRGGGRDAAVAAAVAAEIVSSGGRAQPDDSDVSTVAGAAEVVERAGAAFGGVDIVVNNAGVSGRARVEDLDDETLDLHLGVHLKGTVGVTRAAFPIMRGRGGGSIVNTVSGAGLFPQHAGTSAYACAKAAVAAFTKVAAIEGAADGIRVNAVSPLAVTRMSEAFFASDPGAEERLRPERVSVVVAFLASPLARAITGRVLRVEGGQVCEVFTDRTPGAEAQDWTPETLAARIGEVLRA
jgi:NAD(P)-dependent dehydrogenase (short-subunit alcohol dehydrogenase family)